MSDIVQAIFCIWPWTIGFVLYVAILKSDQGRALATAFTSEGPETFYVVGSVVFAGIVVGVGTLLAQVARAPQGASIRLSAPIVVAGVSVCIAIPAYGVALAAVTGSAGAWYSAGLVGAAGLFSFAWLVYSWYRNPAQSNTAIKRLFAHRVTVAWVALLVSVSPVLGGALLAQTHPIVFSRAGPLLVSMGGITTFSNLFAAWFILVPRLLNVQWLRIVLVSTSLTWLLFQPDNFEIANPLIREETVAAMQAHQSDATCKKTPDRLMESVDAHLSRPHTVRPYYDADENMAFLINAEGGGIRAAYWTAITLGQMDIWSRDAFGERVTTLSGVSGSALGVAAWLAAHERMDLDPKQRLALIKHYLGSDFLSPLIGGLFFLDLPRALFGPAWFKPGRAQVFEKAIADIWRQEGHTDFFSRPYFALCVYGFDLPPAIFFGSTDALTGTYVPLTTSTKDFWGDQTNVGDVRRTTLAMASVAQIVHVSARFPYLAPPAMVGAASSKLAENLVEQHDSRAGVKGDTALSNSAQMFDKEDRLSRVALLVDGGYVDNLAIAPTKMVLASLALKKELPTRVVKLISIENDPRWSCVKPGPSVRTQATRWTREILQATGYEFSCEHFLRLLDESFEPLFLPWLTAPISALIGARSYHTEESGANLNQELFNTPLARAGGRFSVFGGLADALDPKSAKLFSDDIVIERSRAAGAAELKLSEAKSLLDHHLIEAKTYSNFQSDVNAYLRSVDENVEHDDICSAPRLSLTAPPLGWTLTGQNRNLLDCLNWHNFRQLGMDAAMPMIDYAPALEALAARGRALLEESIKNAKGKAASRQR